MITLAPMNDRSFLGGSFIDRSGESCSIQESSLATEACLWLGQDNPTYDRVGRFCGCRMHLTQQMAAELIPLLQRFVETGELRE